MKYILISQGGEPLRKWSRTRWGAQHNWAATGLLWPWQHGFPTECCPADWGECVVLWKLSCWTQWRWCLDCTWIVALCRPQIGPRMTLQLMKIQDGLGEGNILYHSMSKWMLDFSHWSLNTFWCTWWKNPYEFYDFSPKVNAYWYIDRLWLLMFTWV